VEYGGFLKKLKKMSFYNSPVSKKEIVIERDLSKNFLVLTGFNGVGKSRIISMIYETLALARGVESEINRVGWAAQIDFEGGVGVRALKMSNEGISNESLREHVSGLFKAQSSLADLYGEAEAGVKSKRSFANIKSSGESNAAAAFGCSAVLSRSQELADELTNTVEVLAYIEDQLYFNYNRVVPDTVFEGKANIDKTLYALFYNFLVKHADNKDTKKIVYSLLDEYKSLNGDFDPDAAVEYVSSKLSDAQIFGGASSYESSSVFEELNKFFALTDRKLIWRGSYAAMKVPGGDVVPWIEFSKGEKTLLALMLTIYLYGESASFVFDEPDLSLHMEWQKMLFPAFLALAPNAQFIVSTHSPFMVMNTNSEQIINLAKYHKEA